MRNSALRTASTIVTALLLALACGTQAHAAPAPLPSKLMLATGDVPSSLGTMGSVAVQKTLSPILGACESATGVPLYQITAPGAQFQASLSTSGNPATQVQVREGVYQYGSTQASSAAFAQLKAGVAKCLGTSTANDGNAGAMTTALTNGTSTVAGSAAPWFAVGMSLVPPSGGSPQRQATMSIKTLKGNAIISTDLLVTGSTQLTPAQVAALTTIATAVTNRWAG